MLKKPLLIATFLCAVAGPAFAQTGSQPSQMPAPQSQQGQRQSPFERLDRNTDGVITIEEVRTARTEAFTRLDANRDGFLVREEMPTRNMAQSGDGPREMPKAPGSDRKMKHQGGGELLSRADTNNDGNVTRAEYNAAWAVQVAAVANQGEQRREAMFVRLDTNRDNAISRAEADAARAQMQERRPPRGQDDADGRQRPPMQSPDTNNDQKVSLTEWLARPDPLFERGDANKDGRLTREEAAAVVRQGRGEGNRNGRPW
jgi:Ca2+-binding EF-hand superfamily protein